MRRRTIGVLATEANVGVETVRYYQRRGLLPRPEPKEGRFRVYDADAVFTIRFIKTMQELGFTLTEIRKLLGVLSDGPRFCHQAGEAAEVKIGQLEEKIRQLILIRDALRAWLTSCETQDGKGSCPGWERLMDAFR